jgi:hypothetical protein
MDIARVGVRVLALVMIVALAPAHPPEVAGLGMIVRGSIARRGSSLRMTLEDPFAIDVGWPGGKTIDVVVIGELPDTVCEGTRVYVRGVKTANGLVASVIEADRAKYDPCFRWHCHPSAYEACRGGPDVYQ